MSHRMHYISFFFVLVAFMYSRFLIRIKPNLWLICCPVVNIQHNNLFELVIYHGQVFKAEMPGLECG